MWNRSKYSKFIKTEYAGDIATSPATLPCVRRNPRANNFTLVDKKTVPCHNKLEIINQNPNRISNSCFSSRHNFKTQLIRKKSSKELKIGDIVKGNRNSGTAKLYHYTCYDNIFIAVDDWFLGYSFLLIIDLISLGGFDYE